MDGLETYYPTQKGKAGKKIRELAEKYQPLMCLGMEKFALEKVLKINLNEEMQRRQFVIPIRDLETNTRVSKQARIRAL